MSAGRVQAMNIASVASPEDDTVASNRDVGVLPGGSKPMSDPSVRA